MGQSDSIFLMLRGRETSCIGFLLSGSSDSLAVAITGVPMSTLAVPYPLLYPGLHSEPPHYQRRR